MKKPSSPLAASVAVVALTSRWTHTLVDQFELIDQGFHVVVDILLIRQDQARIVRVDRAWLEFIEA